MAAFANANGGMIIIGVDDNGIIHGLNTEDIHRLNPLISNAANQHVRGPVNPLTENIQTEQGLVVVVHIPEGNSKPYFDRHGVVWVKSGADKRKINSREELRRIFPSADLLHADEIPVNGTNINDLHIALFEEFYQKVYGEEPFVEEGISKIQLLQNLNLAKGGELNLAGLMLFGKRPQQFKPSFMIKAVAFYGEQVEDNAYLDNSDIAGRLKDQYEAAIAFTKRNLFSRQNGRGINTLGELEVPEITLQEILVNA